MLQSWELFSSLILTRATVGPLEIPLLEVELLVDTFDEPVMRLSC